MQVFIQVNIQNSATFTFGQPLLQWLRSRAPKIVLLDVDSFSDQMLVNQACRLIPAATLYAVYFKAEEPNANLGAAFRLLEEIIQEEKPGLILVEGTHARLTAIVKARPYLLLKPIQNLEEAKTALVNYFELADTA